MKSTGSISSDELQRIHLINRCQFSCPSNSHWGGKPGYHQFHNLCRFGHGDFVRYWLELLATPYGVPFRFCLAKFNRTDSCLLCIRLLQQSRPEYIFALWMNEAQFSVLGRQRWIDFNCFPFSVAPQFDGDWPFAYKVFGFDTFKYRFKLRPFLLAICHTQWIQSSQEPTIICKITELINRKFGSAF